MDVADVRLEAEAVQHVHVGSDADRLVERSQSLVQILADHHRAVRHVRAPAPGLLLGEPPSVGDDRKVMVNRIDDAPFELLQPRGDVNDPDARILLEQPDRPLDHRGGVVVVIVVHGHEAPRGQADRVVPVGVQAESARVGVVLHLVAERSQVRPRLGCVAVVGDDDLDVRIGLRQDAPDDRRQRCRPVVGRDAHADQRPRRALGGLRPAHDRSSATSMMRAQSEGSSGSTMSSRTVSATP